MSRYELVLRKDGYDVSSYMINAEGLVLGRAAECDVILPDSRVSRRHARIWLENGDLLVNDLGSRNGVLVNGARVDRLRIDEGDEVILGNYFFVVKTLDEDLHAMESLADTGSMITFERADAIYEEMVANEGSGRLPVLYRAAQLLGSVFDLDELLSQILSLIFEALPAQRGFILTLDREREEPLVRASQSRDMDGEGPPLSKTLIRHVFSMRTAILTSNAQQDARFDVSDSMLDYNIHAAMCVPLIGRHSLTGAIYVDSGTADVAFNNDDLELLTTIGRVVGVAVENAHLYKESVEQERLAAIGQATTGIGHCVKNILVGIKCGCEFVELGLGKKDWKWVERGYPLTKTASDRIEALVMNLLSFSRDRQLDIGPTDLDGIIEEVLAMLRPSAGKHGVQLERLSGNVGVVHIDGREVYRVILNLVTNAIEACEDNGGKVELTTSRDRHGCYIVVRDTGPGIPETVMEQLFELFVSTKAERGTGLGLACSEKIIRAHGGRIDVESEKGKGSEFRIFLPSRPIVGHNDVTMPPPL